jgi:hypothetical protein
LTNDSLSTFTTGLVPVIVRILELGRGSSAAVRWVRHQLHSRRGPHAAHNLPRDEPLVRQMARELAAWLLTHDPIAETLIGEARPTVLAFPDSVTTSPDG